MKILNYPQLPSGTRIWVKARDDHVVWESAEVLSQAGSVLTLRRGGGAATETLDLGFADAHERNDDVVADMTALRHLNEPAVLANLEARLQASPDPAPYTFMGPVLVALNPMRRVPDAKPEEAFVGARA